MSSILIKTSIERLQKEVVKTLSQLQDSVGIFVSLNKTQKSVEAILRENNINIDKLFFIDCVTSEQSRESVIHIRPNNLNLLFTTIEAFVKEIPGNKFLIIDAISTLLIYNNENKVAGFVKDITCLTSAKGIDMIAFTPQTKGEELLDKIYNFFDEVEDS